MCIFCPGPLQALCQHVWQYRTLCGRHHLMLWKCSEGGSRPQFWWNATQCWNRALGWGELLYAGKLMYKLTDLQYPPVPSPVLFSVLVPIPSRPPSTSNQFTVNWGMKFRYLNLSAEWKRIWFELHAVMSGFLELVWVAYSLPNIYLLNCSKIYILSVCMAQASINTLQ